jgi:hypothetical protein
VSTNDHASPKLETNLARLSGSEQKHFDFVLGEHAVLLELALDLVIACGAWGVVRQYLIPDAYIHVNGHLRALASSSTTED